MVFVRFRDHRGSCRGPGFFVVSGRDGGRQDHSRRKVMGHFGRMGQGSSGGGAVGSKSLALSRRVATLEALAVGGLSELHVQGTLGSSEPVAVRVVAVGEGHVPGPEVGLPAAATVLEGMEMGS